MALLVVVVAAAGALQAATILSAGARAAAPRVAGATAAGSSDGAGSTDGIGVASYGSHSGIYAGDSPLTSASERATTPSSTSEPSATLAVPLDGAPAPVAAANGPSGFKIIAGVPFTKPENCGGFAPTCQILLDVYAPTGHGPFPTVVLVRGGPSGLGGRSYLDGFARQLAGLGVLVFNADYRDSTDQGGGYPGAFQDVSCAVRFARSNAGSYGGDGSTVTLVGHSLGGWVGSVVALNPGEFDGGNCLADGSGRPDAFAGLAGCYQLDAGDVVSDLAVFFGGYVDQTEAARASSDPFNYATGTSIPVRILAGTADTSVDPYASVALYSFLTDRNWNVGLTLVSGGTHMSILRPDATGAHSVAVVFSAIAAARSNANAIDPLKARWGE